MIVIGALLAPVALVSAWAVSELSDTDSFVATFAPLGANDDVQAFLAQRVTETIEEQVDFTEISSSIVGAVIPSTGTVGSLATEALTGVLEQSMRQLVAGGVSRVVESDTFSAMWEETLRASHSVVIAALENDPDGVLSLGEGGELGIQLGPIVERVKTALVDGGLGFAAQIPEVDRTIVIVTSDSLATVQVAYGMARTVAFWLPWLALALVIGGLFVAGATVRSLIVSAGGVALGMVVLLVGLAIGRAIVLREFGVAGLPDTVGAVLFDQVVGGIYAASVTVLVSVLVIAFLAWLFGPFDVVGRVRRLTGDSGEDDSTPPAGTVEA